MAAVTIHRVRLIVGIAFITLGSLKGVFWRLSGWQGVTLFRKVAMTQFLKVVTTEKVLIYGQFRNQEDIFGFGFSRFRLSSYTRLDLSI